MRRCPLGTPRPLKSRGGARGLAWTQSVSGARTAGRTACLLRPTRTSGAGPALPHSAASGVLAAAGIEQHPRSTGACSHSTRSLATGLLLPCPLDLKRKPAKDARGVSMRDRAARFIPRRRPAATRATLLLCGEAARRRSSCSCRRCTPALHPVSMLVPRRCAPAAARRRAPAVALARWARHSGSGSFPRRARGFLLVSTREN